MEEHLFDEIKRYVDFNAADELRLVALEPRAAPHLPRIVDDFYDHILRHTGARQSISGGHAQVARLKVSLTHWLAGLFQGPWDLGYYERRARIGRVHVAIDLPQQYMFTAVNVIRAHLADVVLSTASPEELRPELHAVDKLLDMELAIMLHTYREDSLHRLRQGERLATFGQLVASIAHELRNPLGVIESSLFLVRKRLDPAPEPVARHFDKIEAQVRLSNRIISSLLDMVRERPAAPREVGADTLCQAAQEAVTAARSTPLTLELRVTPGVLVFADPDQAQQVLVNLLLNAADAAGPSGRVRLTADTRGAFARFLVEDTGPGIAPEVRRRLFEPLVSTKARGIGLGLALCKRLAERNRGSIGLVQAELPGAAFEFLLPLSTGSAE
ncbi:MAG: HAMP domain-containing histidine kinase [Deltaproteobacteria bacterium]|nr:HAMP domain-containing histidine kinase [Deltaproteobacteria bacterium]